MKTKVTILGEEPQKKELKKIEFVKILMSSLKVEETEKEPEHYHLPFEWANIILLHKNYGGGLDLMFAKSDDINDGCLFLGHFNDGVV